MLANGANKALENKNAVEKEVVAFRTNISSRYSSRLIWTFLTIVFTALCLSAILFSALYVMKITLPAAKRRTWLWASVVISSVWMALPFLFEQPVMSIAPLGQSLYAKGDISSWAVEFFNAIAFAAIVFLVAAVCAILYKVGELTEAGDKMRNELIAKLSAIDEAKPDLPEPPDSAPLEDKAASDSAIQRSSAEVQTLAADLQAAEGGLAAGYDALRNDTRLILYIGSALLFIGILRIDVIYKWHLAFVYSGFSELLKSFFQSVLSIQAGFFTILLAAIYLPAVYMIPETPQSPTTKESVDRRGFFVTLREFAPRLIAVILPLLAPPVADLFKYFFEAK